MQRIKYYKIEFYATSKTYDKNNSSYMQPTKHMNVIWVE